MQKQVERCATNPARFVATYYAGERVAVALAAALRQHTAVEKVVSELEEELQAPGA